MKRPNTTALLEGTEEEEALALIAQTARQVADADTALIILPSVGDTWACEIAEGYAADELLGTVFPPEGRAMAVRREGAGMIVDSFVRAPVVRIPAMKKFGPALYAPLMSGKVAEGVLVLLRKPERLEFEPGDLPGGGRQRRRCSRSRLPKLDIQRTLTPSWMNATGLGATCVTS